MSNLIVSKIEAAILENIEIISLYDDGKVFFECVYERLWCTYTSDLNTCTRGIFFSGAAPRGGGFRATRAPRRGGFVPRQGI